MGRGECPSTKENVRYRVNFLGNPTTVARSNSTVQQSILLAVLPLEWEVDLDLDDRVNWRRRDSLVEGLQVAYG